VASSITSRGRKGGGERKGMLLFLASQERKGRKNVFSVGGDRTSPVSRPKTKEGKKEEAPGSSLRFEERREGRFYHQPVCLAIRAYDII